VWLSAGQGDCSIGSVSRGGELGAGSSEEEAACTSEGAGGGLWSDEFL